MKIEKLAPCRLNINVMTFEEKRGLSHSIGRRKNQGLELFETKMLVAPITDEIRDLVAFPDEGSEFVDYMIVDGEQKYRVWIELAKLSGQTDIEIPDKLIDIKEMSRSEIKQTIWDRNIRGHRNPVLMAEFLYDEWKRGLGNLTQAELANKYSMSRERVTNLLKISTDTTEEILKDYKKCSPANITQSDLEELARLRLKPVFQKKLYDFLKTTKHKRIETRMMVDDAKEGHVTEKKTEYDKVSFVLVKGVYQDFKRICKKLGESENTGFNMAIRLFNKQMKRAMKEYRVKEIKEG